MKIEIMSWNTALTERIQGCENVISYIKKFLEKKNSIAVLQQIPYKDKKEQDWVFNSTYISMRDTFSEVNGYNFLFNENYNDGYIHMMTVVITKIEQIKEVNELFYPNNKITSREKAVAIQSNGKERLIILGIHAKNGYQNNEYLKAINGNADIVLGDFNAGNYSESENILTFNSILKDHVCICNMPTKEIRDKDGRLKRKSCIDHIFVKRKLVSQCSDLIIHENICYSDHYPISFKIEI